MPVDFDWTGLERIRARHDQLIKADYMPLMNQWTDILWEGNRRGVLSGVDGNDVPMPPLKYRTGQGKRTANRRRPKYGSNRFAALLGGAGDNLTTAQYQELTGPRLAPRGEQSRSIRNLFKEVRRNGDEWIALCFWDHVVSKEGVSFFPYHFNGEGHNPRYDLRPIRARDFEFCRNAARAYVKSLILRSI